MDPLRIVRAKPNEYDPNATWYDLHLSRPMTEFERRIVPAKLSGAGFYSPPSEVKHPNFVTIQNTPIALLESKKDVLQQLVSEAEAEAKAMQERQEAEKAQAEANWQDAKRRAEAIDWNT